MAIDYKCRYSLLLLRVTGLLIGCAIKKGNCAARRVYYAANYAIFLNELNELKKMNFYMPHISPSLMAVYNSMG